MDNGERNTPGDIFGGYQGQERRQAKSNGVEVYRNMGIDDDSSEVFTNVLMPHYTRYIEKGGTLDKYVNEIYSCFISGLSVDTFLGAESTISQLALTILSSHNISSIKDDILSAMGNLTPVSTEEEDILTEIINRRES